MKPLGVELWLKQLALAPKTKGHLQNLLRVLFNCATRWELVDFRENPVKLVRVRGGSKRTKEPKVLTIAQFPRSRNRASLQRALRAQVVRRDLG